MTTIITARPVPNERAKIARERLRRKNYTAAVTRDGITSISVIVPHTVTPDQGEEALKLALDFEADHWEFKHTRFERGDV